MMIIKKLSISKVEDVNFPINLVKLARSLVLKEDFHKEHSIVFYFQHEQIKSAEVVSIGDLTSCSSKPSCIFKSAILNDYDSIIVLHNHPNDDLIPSEKDLETYKQLKKCGEILEIPVTDAIIFNNSNRSFSLEKDYYCS